MAVCTVVSDGVLGAGAVRAWADGAVCTGATGCVAGVAGAACGSAAAEGEVKGGVVCGASSEFGVAGLVVEGFNWSFALSISLLTRDFSASSGFVGVVLACGCAGVAGAAVGMLAGIPFGLPGIILGPAVGAFALEFARNPDARKAGMAGLGGIAGFVLGIVAKSFFGLLIVGLAVLAYFF